MKNLTAISYIASAAAAPSGLPKSLMPVAAAVLILYGYGLAKLEAGLYYLAVPVLLLTIYLFYKKSWLASGKTERYAPFMAGVNENGLSIRRDYPVFARDITWPEMIAAGFSTRASGIELRIATENGTVMVKDEEPGRPLYRDFIKSAAAHNVTVGNLGIMNETQQ